MKTIAILSEKDRLEKTSIGSNFAYYLADKGNNVCLLDLDFANPSLIDHFTPEGSWLNNSLTEEEMMHVPPKLVI